MLFGSNRDFDLLVQINRELLKDIVEQEILYSNRGRRYNRVA